MFCAFDWRAIHSSATFTGDDWVSNKLKHWLPILAPMRAMPLKILEIGSYEGRSALFFLSYFPHATIICIDPFFGGREAIFDNNLAPYADRLTKIRDFSLPALIDLRQTEEEFDLVYIDGNHERESVLMDSVLVWGMLKLNGILIWDDYGGKYKRDHPNWDHPTSAVNGFLVAYADEYREEARFKQLIVRKTQSTPRCRVRLSRVSKKPNP